MSKKKKEDKKDWTEDPDVQEFLEMADTQGPWSKENDKIYTIGGLTADEDGDFMKFQKKQEENDELNKNKE